MSIAKIPNRNFGNSSLPQVTTNQTDAINVATLQAITKNRFTPTLIRSSVTPGDNGNNNVTFDNLPDGVLIIGFACLEYPCLTLGNQPGQSNFYQLINANNTVYADKAGYFYDFNTVTGKYERKTGYYLNTYAPKTYGEKAASFDFTNLAEFLIGSAFRKTAIYTGGGTGWPPDGLPAIAAYQIPGVDPSPFGNYVVAQKQWETFVRLKEFCDQNNSLINAASVMASGMAGNAAGFNAMHNFLDSGSEEIIQFFNSINVNDLRSGWHINAVDIDFSAQYSDAYGPMLLVETLPEYTIFGLALDYNQFES